MTKLCHLPIAVRYDAETVEALGDLQILFLIDECDRWFGGMAEFKSALATKAARTEWKVLSRPDFAAVEDAQARLKAEIEARHGTHSEQSNPQAPPTTWSERT